MKTVALVGTFDSKGNEYFYLKELMEHAGVSVLTIHCGVFEPVFTPDISNGEVAKAAGADITLLAEKRDRGNAVATLSKGIEALLPKLYADGRFDGVFALGGTGGTSLVTPGMRALPVGVPKIMVSTIAGGDVSAVVGTSDIIMVPSVVDVAGLNSISDKIFTNAAFAMVGMLTNENVSNLEKKPTVAATMFGVTTPCVNAAREYLEARGYEVLTFHATGTGGRCMEDLIRSGFIKGVLDITTTEWCDELFGGVFTAGPHRSEAAGMYGVPQVVSVGAMDMVNFHAIDTVPEKYRNRNLYKHNPTVTLMRTTVEENRLLGEKLAEKLNMTKSKTALFLPLQGVSVIDAVGQPFYGAEEDAMLFNTLRDNVDTSKTEIVELDLPINSPEFAQAMAQKLLEYMA